VNHATVARRVTQLETRLGAAFFQPSLRSSVLTAGGNGVLEEDHTNARVIQMRVFL
jgi:DNA-binding transcriptional LysR family regulator